MIADLSKAMRFVIFCCLLTITLCQTYGQGVSQRRNTASIFHQPHDNIVRNMVKDDDLSGDESESDNEIEDNSPKMFEVIWINHNHHAECTIYDNDQDADQHYRKIPSDTAKLIRDGGAVIELSDPDPYRYCDSVHEHDDDLHDVRPGLRSSYSKYNLSEYITSTEDLFQSVQSTGQISIDVAVIKAPWVQNNGDYDLSPRLQGALFAMDHGHQMASALFHAGFSASTIFVALPHHQPQQLQQPKMFWILSNLKRYDDNDQECKFAEVDAADLKEALISMGENEEVTAEVVSLTMSVPYDDQDEDFDDDTKFYEHKLTKHSPRKILSVLFERDSSLKSQPMTMSAIKTAKHCSIKVWDCPASLSASSGSILRQHSSSTSLFTSTPKSCRDAPSSSFTSSSALPSLPSSRFLSRTYSFGGKNLEQFVKQREPEVILASNEISLTSRCKFRLDSNSNIRYSPSADRSSEIDQVSDPFEYALPKHLSKHQTIELMDISSGSFLKPVYDDLGLEFDFVPDDDTLFTCDSFTTAVHDAEVGGIPSLWSELQDVGVSELGIIQSIVETYDRPAAVGYRTDFTVKGIVRPGVNSRITLGSYFKKSMFEARAVAGPCIAQIRGPTAAAAGQISITGLQAFATADLYKAEANICGVGLGFGLSLHTGICIGPKCGLSLAGFGLAVGSSCSIWTPIASLTLPII